jgi:hypothetical protein
MVKVSIMSMPWLAASQQLIRSWVDKGGTSRCANVAVQYARLCAASSSPTAQGLWMAAEHQAASAACLHALCACLQGVSPGTASIATAASSTLKLPITVTKEPACLVQLHTAATTGAALAAAGSNSSSSGSGSNSSSSSSTSASGPSLRPGQTLGLMWQARQDLVWEDSSALVLTYARFTDDSVMDVTDKTAVVAAAPGGTTLPFTFSTDNTTGLSWIKVNVQVGTSAPCQQYLQSSWAVCSNSVQLGTGQGSVAVTLPTPTAVSGFTASPGSITSSDSPAGLNPVLVATSSKLALQVAFDDGVVRDFSTDQRVVYGLAPDSTLCEVLEGEGHNGSHSRQLHS